MWLPEFGSGSYNLSLINQCVMTLSLLQQRPKQYDESEPEVGCFQNYSHKLILFTTD